jgi:tetratricopeptide (TPR) repeat protein
LEAAGSYEEAAEIIEGLIGRADEDTQQLGLLKMRASVRAAVGDQEGAIADLEAVYARDADAVGAELEAALQRRKEHAAQHDDKEIERTTILRLVEIMIAQERREFAMELLLEWVNRESDDAEIMYALVNMYEEDERYDDVAKIYGRLVDIEKGEKQIQVAAQYADACIRIGNPDAARVQLEQVALRQPESKEIRNELRKVYELVGAQKELAMLLKEDADNEDDPVERAELLRRVGIALLSIDEIEEATPALLEALKLVPGDPEATAALADVHLANDEEDQASKILDEAIAACKNQRSPELSVLQHRKSRVAKSQGDHEGELSWLKQALLSDRTSGWIAVQLANRAEEYEDWDMAIWALRTIAMMKEDIPLPRAEVFLRQGKIALVRGDERRAKLFARQAEQEDAESESVRAFLSKLEVG